MKDNNYKITIESPAGDIISLTIHDTDHISTWRHPIVVLLTWIGFQPCTINDLLNTED